MLLLKKRIPVAYSRDSQQLFTRTGHLMNIHSELVCMLPGQTAARGGFSSCQVKVFQVFAACRNVRSLLGKAVMIYGLTRLVKKKQTIIVSLKKCVLSS